MVVILLSIGKDQANYLVKIHEKEKEASLGFKVSRSGGIWLES